MFEATLLITNCINTIERHAAGESDLMRRRSAVEESVRGCMGDGAMRCHRLQASLWCGPVAPRRIL